MNIGIVGWYGSETLGDRAILDGIIRFLKLEYKEVNISLASLNPFFSNRTIMLDKDIYIADSLSVIDVRDGKAVIDFILHNEIIIFGGGPLMDSVSEIELMARIFKISKKRKKKTVIFGCGLQESLLLSRYRHDLNDLVDSCDLILWRDYSSARVFEREFDIRSYVVPDPAILSALVFNNKEKTTRKEYYAINFRNINSITDIEKKKMSELVELAVAKGDNVRLVPMNDFYWGGDDRALFDSLELNCKVDVIRKPMNLYDMYRCYSEARGCVGMRYHAVVFQTILNGNNFILDYTVNGTKKIMSFLETLKYKDFYRNRVFSTQELEYMNLETIYLELQKNSSYNCIDDFSYEKIINEYRCYWEKLF